MLLFRLKIIRHTVNAPVPWGNCPEIRIGSAIGAEVRLFWNGQQQVQEVSGGSGFCSQNQRRLHFGVGPSTRVNRVEITGPQAACK
ncbi:MAG: ASPIC/UnbV domain-containing protein [Acidobacteriaceae bacterium]|nr:ASPIC/UnbV domain-containing protein [Acidobacteriaceae bacterium]